MGLEDGVPWKQHLWRALVAPLEEELQRRQAKHLVLVPDFALNFVPMHQLEGPRGALGDSYQISYAPNLSVVAAAVARPTAVPPPPSITVVCAPPGVFRYGGAELTAIRQVAPCAVRVPPGESVSESELREALAQSSIVHFATHGRFDDREPERSGLMLNRDRWLTLDKIRELVLPGSLVYLSACDTARLRLVSRERALGVAESMLFAGASTVISTIWPVEEVSTALIVSRFYRNLLRKEEPLSRVGSLQEATTWLRKASAEEVRREALAIGIDEGNRKRRFAAPYYWAPFTLQGRWL